MSALTGGVSWVGPVVLTALGKGSGDTVKKNGKETMEILEAFDKTKSAHSAAMLAGCDPKTVRRLVARREAGLGADAPIEVGGRPHRSGGPARRRRRRHDPR